MPCTIEDTFADQFETGQGALHDISTTQQPSISSPSVNFPVFNIDQRVMDQFVQMKIYLFIWGFMSLSTLYRSYHG